MDRQTDRPETACPQSFNPAHKKRWSSYPMFFKDVAWNETILSPTIMTTGKSSQNIKPISTVVLRDQNKTWEQQLATEAWI